MIKMLLGYYGAHINRWSQPNPWPAASPEHSWQCFFGLGGLDPRTETGHTSRHCGSNGSGVGGRRNLVHLVHCLWAEGALHPHSSLHFLFLLSLHCHVIFAAPCWLHMSEDILVTAGALVYYWQLDLHSNHHHSTLANTISGELVKAYQALYKAFYIHCLI